MEFSNETETPVLTLEPPPAPPEEFVPPTKSIWSGLGSALRELIETLVLTLVIFLLIRFAVQNFRIEGYSMEPNFHDGQFILVNKIEYMVKSPQRGDVVVLIPPTSANRDFIKRIIALPGDTVQIIDGRVSVNGALLDEPYPLNPGSYSFGPTTIAPDEYFVLGDNRNNSSDSHAWGSVVKSKIVGKVWATYWPPQMIGFVPDYSYAQSKSP
ncbi:MAG: signal peptidase I [Chloroflexi bacterium]|nr:signal peptidase I [Chloroflexota bacterium]